MKTCLILFLSFTLISISNANAVNEVPKDFVSVQELDPSIQVDLKYLSADNFLGRPVQGYKSNTCYLTKPAAEALVLAQKDLKQNGHSLKMLDCYRPQQAVDDFVTWSKDLKDQKMKSQYYPKIQKELLFKSGYIASRSGHSRGSTVDLTLVELKSGKEVDMGTAFDVFDSASHTEFEGLSSAQKANRQVLKTAMERQGYQNYSKEWWHFTLKKEPHPKTFFNFQIEDSKRTN